MGMQARATRPLSTLLFDDQTGKHLIRVSVWVEPEDVDVLDGQQDTDSPTLAVEVPSRRLRGKIDRQAYKVWMTQDAPPLAPFVPVPDGPESIEVRHRAQMYR